MQRRRRDVATELLSFDFQHFDHVPLVFCIEKATRRGVFVAVEEEFGLLLLYLRNRHGMNSICGLESDRVEHILFCAKREDDISQQTQQE